MADDIQVSGRRFLRDCGQSAVSPTGTLKRFGVAMIELPPNVYMVTRIEPQIRTVNPRHAFGSTTRPGTAS